MTSKLPFQLSPLSTKQVTHRNTGLEKNSITIQKRTLHVLLNSQMAIIKV